MTDSDGPAPGPGPAPGNLPAPGTGPAPASAVGTAVAGAFRQEWGRITAALIHQTGDWDLAEECAQDAFTQALRRWPADGVPSRPGRG